MNGYTLMSRAHVEDMGRLFLVSNDMKLQSIKQVGNTRTTISINATDLSRIEGNFGVKVGLKYPKIEM